MIENDMIYTLDYAFSFDSVYGIMKIWAEKKEVKWFEKIMPYKKARRLFYGKLLADRCGRMSAIKYVVLVAGRIMRKIEKLEKDKIKFIHNPIAPPELRYDRIHKEYYQIKK